MIEDEAVHFGLRPIERRLVPWRDLRPVRQNALRRAILGRRDDAPFAILRGELDRYLQADEHFFLAAARALLSMKDALWLDGLAEDGGLSPAEAARARSCQRFFVHDCSSLLLHTRILCDRALPTLRFVSATLPISLTSFQDHRRKILAGAELPDSLARWADYVRANTRWFDLLKELRDDFVVHQGSRHMLFFWQRSDHDIEMVIMVPRDPRSPRPLANIRALSISPRSLIVCVTEFLNELAHALPTANGLTSR